MIKDILLTVMQEDTLGSEGMTRGWFLQPTGGFPSPFGSMLFAVLPKNMCKIFQGEGESIIFDTLPWDY